MRPAPRVSVLLPVRDAAATLAAALRSVERQSEAHHECVVVDDGSRDATAAVAEAAARRDPRVRLLRRPRRGLVAALGEGLAACRAPLVARMDADDVMHRARLALQCAALDAEPQLAAVGCHVRLFPRCVLSDGMRRYEAWLNGIRTPADVRADAFVECPVAHPTLCARTPLLREDGWRDVDVPEDYDLLLRWLAAGREVGMVPRRLHLWREHPDRLSRRDPRYARERFVACKARHLARGFLAGRSDYVLWGYGGTGRTLRRALQAHGLTPSHVVELHPGRLGQRIHGAPVIPPSALACLRPARVVVSVAGAVPRAGIRAALAEMRFREGHDFVCAA